MRLNGIQLLILAAGFLAVLSIPTRKKPLTRLTDITVQLHQETERGLV